MSPRAGRCGFLATGQVELPRSVTLKYFPVSFLVKQTLWPILSLNQRPKSPRCLQDFDYIHRSSIPALTSSIPRKERDRAQRISKHKTLLAITDIDVPQANVAQELPFQIGGEATVRCSSGDSFEVVLLTLPIKPRVLRNRRRECDLVEACKTLPVLRLEESLCSLLQSLLEAVRIVWRLKEIDILGQNVWMEKEKGGERTSPACCRLGSFDSDEGAELTRNNGRRRRLASRVSCLCAGSKSSYFFMDSPFCLLARMCSFSCSKSFDIRMVPLLVG
jgi:hypothetical protein